MNGANYISPARQAHDTAINTNELLAQWPDFPKQVAQNIIATYGLPHEASTSQMMWYNQEPWKLTTVFRDGVWHNFPHQHLDILRQTIDYRVPPEKVDDVSMFDGSIVVDRTRGELSVCSESEPMNILAINIAHQLIQGKITVEDARRKFTEAAVALRLRWPVPDSQKLDFSTVRDYEFQLATADPDQVTVNKSLFNKITNLFRG